MFQFFMANIFSFFICVLYCNINNMRFKQSATVFTIKLQVKYFAIYSLSAMLEASELVDSKYVELEKS